MRRNKLMRTVIYKVEKTAWDDTLIAWLDGLRARRLQVVIVLICLLCLCGMWLWRHFG